MLRRPIEDKVSWKDIVQNLLAEPDPWFSERIHARYLAARGRRAFFKTKQALPLEEP